MTPRAVRPGRFVLARALVGLAAVCLALVPTITGAADEQSEIKPLAGRSLLLAVSASGGLTVAVGERGHVLVSRDEGRSWTQVVVPTRVTLTSIALVNENSGCAAGHDAVIICTEDGGQSWSLVHHEPDQDLPLLDVWFRDDRRALVVGAYGTLVRSDDGGATWREDLLESEPLESPGAGSEDAADDWLGDYHVNRLAAAPGGRVFAAAESGTLYRSDDAGDSWVELPSPYEGSFFGVLPLDRETVLAFGLRGHLFRSDDGGSSWNSIETDTDALLSTGLELPDGRLLIAGLAGTLLVSSDRGQSFELIELAGRDAIADALVTGDGALLLVGEFGVRREDPARLLAPAAAAAGSPP